MMWAEMEREGRAREPNDVRGAGLVSGKKKVSSSCSSEVDEKATEDRLSRADHQPRGVLCSAMARAEARAMGDIGIDDEGRCGQFQLGRRREAGETHLLDNGLGKGLTHDGRSGRAAAMATEMRSNGLGLWSRTRRGEEGSSGAVEGGEES